MDASDSSTDDERARICDALMELVSAQGYQSTQVGDVIDRAGADRAAFDRSFADLEDCFAAAWDGVDSELTRRMAAAYARGSTWEESLREALATGLRYMAADSKRARLYVAEVIYVSDRMRDRQREALERLGRTIDEGRAGAPEAMRVPPAIADAISGAIWHRAHQLVQSGRTSHLPGELARFMFLAVLPYRGAVAAQSELRER